LFRDSGELREGLFEDIKSSCPVERIIFEAPHSKSQMFFINNIGSNVNLGNVNPMDVLLLETQRLGLRSETFGVVS
jgi:phosphosulfolactate synthase